MKHPTVRAVACGRALTACQRRQVLLHVSERGLGRLLDTDVAGNPPAGKRVLVESYTRFTGLAVGGRSAWVSIAPVVSGGVVPVPQTPFLVWVPGLGVPFDALREMHEAFLASGRMRRFAAVLHHRKAGFGANAMGVWAGPQGDPAALERMGETMAGFRAVSHCYERPSYPDWPYNLFTMVHGKSEDECRQTLAAIADATGLTDWQALFSSKEYKKVRVRYFTDAEAEWEAGVV